MSPQQNNSDPPFWRQCPQCGGVEVLSGDPTLAPEGPRVLFHGYQGSLYVVCSGCGKVLPAV